MICYNGIGQLIYVPERPLEPPDCWREELSEPCEMEYDRAENELNGIFNY